MQNTGAEYAITTGEFAKICGTTRDTLRYYHEQGILVPRKNQQNGYHYYSYAQISSFYFITTLRQLDCSTADIRNYLLTGEETRFDAFIDKQYLALLAQKAELDRKIAMVEVTRDLLGEIRKADLGRPVLCRLPERMRLRLTPVHSCPARSSGEIISDIRHHMAVCSAQGRRPFPMGASIGAADFLNGEYSYRQVFSFADYADEDTLVLSDRCAVVYVCRDSDGDITEIYRRLTRFLQENGLTMHSDVYNLSIVNVIDPHEERRYVKYLFVCVE